MNPKNPTFLLIALAMSLFVGCSEKSTLSQGEGFIDLADGKIWYKIVGEGNSTPLLLLHGGPGSASYYLNSLSPLGADRPVIFFDQLGCGKSERIEDTSLMTIEHYVEQVEELRKKLGLDEFYLYGHSWGTMLGMDYYLKYPSGIKGLIYNSPLFSTKLWIADADTLISTLPDSIQSDIRRNEEAKTFSDPSYIAAVDLFYSKFLIRNGFKPGDYDSMIAYTGFNVYEYMWGPSEFTATGNLKEYDRLADLSKISVPTLLLTGEFDEARPSTVKYYQSLVKDSRFNVIPESGHMTMMDNPKTTISAIREFLDEIEYQ